MEHQNDTRSLLETPTHKVGNRITLEGSKEALSCSQ